jgi:hypothetical protein
MQGVQARHNEGALHTQRNQDTLLLLAASVPAWLHGA